MAQSLEDIFNLALSACGVTTQIGDTNERSREAATCRLWFPLVRDNVQTAAPWPSVIANRRLARLTVSDAPWVSGDGEPGYAFSYACPEDLLLPSHMNSFQPFAYTTVDDVRVISSNEEAPILSYHRRAQVPGLWDHSLTMATIYTLATHIARPITGRSTTVGENKQLASEIVSDMRRAAANSSDQPREVLPDYLSIRGYDNVSPTRFYYPLQSLNFGAAS